MAAFNDYRNTFNDYFNIANIAERNTVQAQEQTASNDYKTKIAVLPFADLKPTAASENFGVDLADLIRNDISRDEDFTVVSSILPEKNFQDAARSETLKDDAGADFILAGTFSVEDEKAEVEYQLIKVKTGKIVLTNKEDLTGENRQQFVKKTVFKIKVYSDALSTLLKKAE